MSLSRREEHIGRQSIHSVREHSHKNDETEQLVECTSSKVILKNCQYIDMIFKPFYDLLNKRLRNCNLIGVTALFILPIRYFCHSLLQRLTQ
jgi:hypothetical protein